MTKTKPTWTNSKNLRPTMTLEQLEKLREDVKTAYKSVVKKDLEVPNSKDEETYEAFRAVIKGVIGLNKYVAEVETLRKFFYDNKYFNYSNKTLKPLRDFIRLSKEQVGEIVEKEIYYGSFTLIDMAFVEKIKGSNYYKESDFYLKLRNETCQWYGVIKNWDFKRSILTKLKNEVVNSFIIECPIALVVYGESGCGKSTLLRRLAIECTECNFKVIWINDVKFFYADDFKKIATSLQKHLLIVDDWTRIKRDKSLSSQVLNSISNCSNIRLVIGDQKIRKIYQHLVVPGNFFKIKSDENESIIRKVLVNVPEWKVIFEDIGTNGNFYDSSLFIILFILGWQAQAGIENNINKLKDAAAAFGSIVDKDISKLFEFSKSLVTFLYLYANAYDRFHFPIKWNTLLTALATTDQIGALGQQFIRFDTKHPICEILARYFYLKKNPLKVKNDLFIYFHHDLLSSVFKSLPIKDQLPYNNNLENELMAFFLEQSDIMAYDNENKTVSTANWSIYNDWKNGKSEEEILKGPENILLEVDVIQQLRPLD